MSPAEIRSELEQFGRNRGVVLFGVAKLSGVNTTDFLLPKETVARLPFALSLGMRLLPEVLANITTHPNLLYEHHYRQVNFALDRIALEISNKLSELGYNVLPIPTSQIVDWQTQRGHLSHKRIAIASGLGWLGRNNLLVTPKFGSQVRLVTILTDLPLEPGVPLNQTCDACQRCISICPAKAIKEKPEDFDHRACFEKLKEFQRRRFVNQFICGLCVKVCSGGLVT